MNRHISLYTLLVRANPTRREERYPCESACTEITSHVRGAVFQYLGNDQQIPGELFDALITSQHMLPAYLWQQWWVWFRHPTAGLLSFERWKKGLNHQIANTLVELSSQRLAERLLFVADLCNHQSVAYMRSRAHMHRFLKRYGYRLSPEDTEELFHEACWSYALEELGDFSTFLTAFLKRWRKSRFSRWEDAFQRGIVHDRDGHILDGQMFRDWRDGWLDGSEVPNSAATLGPHRLYSGELDTLPKRPT